MEKITNLMKQAAACLNNTYLFIDKNDTSNIFWHCEYNHIRISYNSATEYPRFNARKITFVGAFPEYKHIYSGCEEVVYIGKDKFIPSHPEVTINGPETTFYLTPDVKHLTVASNDIELTDEITSLHSIKGNFSEKNKNILRLKGFRNQIGNQHIWINTNVY